MKIAKKVTSIFLAAAVFILLSFSAAAATPQDISCNLENNYIMQSFYANINTTFLTRGETWISADCTAKSKMNIKIVLKVYKDGKLVDTFRSSTYGRGGDIYTDYDFEDGVSYKIKATFKVGSETTTKRISFTN